VQLLHCDRKAESTYTFSSAGEANAKPKTVQETKVERRPQLNPLAAPYARDCDKFQQMGGIQPNCNKHLKIASPQACTKFWLCRTIILLHSCLVMF